jgi:hypothetical protein
LVDGLVNKHPLPDAETNDNLLSGGHFGDCAVNTDGRFLAGYPTGGRWHEAVKLNLVAGMLLGVGAIELDVTTLTQSVVFIKETELLLTSDHWNVVNFNLTPCVATVKTIKAELQVLKEIDKTAAVGELRHIESALVSLENKLADIWRFAPRPSRKRGLIDAGITYRYGNNGRLRQVT